MQNDMQLRISVGQNRKALKWLTENISWAKFLQKISNPVRTNETFEVFMKLKKSQQDELKDVGGFVAGELKDNRRRAKNIINRYLITLDADSIEPGQTQKILNLVDGLQCAYAIYSTRKHCGAKPRLRIIIPLDKPVTPEQYEPIARRVASYIGMEIMDPSTFEASRLMYWPSCSKDSEFVFVYGDKPFASSEGLLNTYNNWQNTSEWPKIADEPDIMKREVEKQKDPLEKDNIIGAFCRVYDINSAIAKFIPDVYQPGDKEDKYTYVNGSVANGATVYGDGKWLYSFHATDPASRILCNSFDLVRIHKFGHLDDEAKEDTPANRLPSYLEMTRFALEDQEVRKEFERQRLEEAQRTFADSLTESHIQKFEAIDTTNADWRMKLQRNKSTGLIERTINNAVIILENDQFFKDKLIYDRFSNRFLIKAPMPWARENESYPKLWSDTDDAELRAYFEKCYEGFKNTSSINDGLLILKNRNSTNVAKEYFENLKWDGISRLDTLLIDYLGAENTEYVKQITRKSLTAVVARAITEREVKFDNMVILTGPQGIGKSTLLSILAGNWFTDNIIDFNSKDTLLLLQNCIIVEVPELQGFNKADTNRLKQFLGQKSDKYRAPYEHREEEHPRHCIFFGTTNDDEFLRDSTGNRRYWPVAVGKGKAIKNIFKELKEERDQIWAEAVMRFRIGEELYLKNDALKVAEKEQQARLIADPWESIIQEYIDRPIPQNWFDKTVSEQRNYWLMMSDNQTTNGLIERDRICASEILSVCLEIEAKKQSSLDRKRVVDIIRKRLDYSYRKSIKFGRSYGQSSGFLRQN